MVKEEKIKRSKLKWQFKIIIILIFIVLYAFFIGPKGIFIKEFKIESNEINNGLHGLKILQFSDLHYGSTVTEKNLAKIIKKINLAKPDIVIFTGDLISEEYKLSNYEKGVIKTQLSNIFAELGKYYVTGEEDFEEATSILNLSGFTNLENNQQLIYGDSKEPILIIGKESSKTYFENNESVPEFKILVLHNPNDFDNLKKTGFDMAISGHTHNGQINIPKVKELFINSDHTKNYEEINKTKLFVNPGIGTSKINIRLFNHPTIYLYRLNKTSAINK